MDWTFRPIVADEQRPTDLLPQREAELLTERGSDSLAQTDADLLAERIPPGPVGGVRRMLRDGVAWLEVILPLVVLACAALLWVASLPLIDPNRMTDLGLVSVLPPSMYAAFIILTVSFCLIVQRRPAMVPHVLLRGWPDGARWVTRRERWAYGPILLLHIILLIAMIHGTPAIVYGTLRYAWAWKHVGIVDYIQRHGSVNPTIPYLNVYHNWPGFFALGALLTQAAGFKSALSFASWAPPFFNLINVGALVMILRTCTRDRRLIWLSVWFFYLGNWVGQDYFSPQALSYFCYLVILGICLRWFGIATVPSTAGLKRWFVPDRVVALIRKLAIRMAPRDQIEVTPRPLRQTGLIVIIILLFAVIVSSHQLTPFMAILAVTALVVLHRCSARSLPILMVIMTVGWIVYMAVAFLDGNLYWIVASIGQATKNADSTLIDLSKVSRGMVFVAYMSRGLTALVWCLALLGFARRRRHGYWDLPCLVLAIVPFFMLAGSSYGGEMLFRVYYFALPFMSFFAASLLFPTMQSGTRRRTTALTVVLSGTLLFGLLFAYYGKERMYYFTPSEVAAAQYLYTHAPAGSLLVDATWNYPRTFVNYDRYDYVTFMYLTKQERAQLRSHPARFIARLMADRHYKSAYLIITRSQKADINMTADMPPGSLDAIERALVRSRRFRVILANHDATIFTLNTRH